MIYVVLDTNILVSSLISSGPPAVILDLVADGRIIPFYSRPILLEYQDVLSRKKFGFSPFNATRLIHDIVRTGIEVEDKLHEKKMIDKKDQMFYNTVTEARGFHKKPVYLVTGNLKHFPVESFIVSPAKFLSIYK